MASVEGRHQLGEYRPNELLVGKLVLDLEILDITAEVAVATVLHVQTQVLRRLEVFALVVGHDVLVTEFLEDR